jgi:hypothetical protein
MSRQVMQLASVIQADISQDSAKPLLPISSSASPQASAQGAAASLPRDLFTVAQDRCSAPVMTLCWGNEFQATVLMLMVVPVHKFQRPFPCFLDALERFARVVRPIFAGPE